MERKSSHRQIVVLPPRHFHLLAAQHGEHAGDPAAGRVWHDHVVDRAAHGNQRARCPFNIPAMLKSSSIAGQWMPSGMIS